MNNKGLAHPSASLRDRAASPSGLSRQEPSSQSGITLRGALHDWRGVFIMTLFFALAVFS